MATTEETATQALTDSIANKISPEHSRDISELRSRLLGAAEKPTEQSDHYNKVMAILNEGRKPETDEEQIVATAKGAANALPDELTLGQLEKQLEIVDRGNNFIQGKFSDIREDLNAGKYGDTISKDDMKAIIEGFGNTPEGQYSAALISNVANLGFQNSQELSKTELKTLLDTVGDASLKMVELSDKTLSRMKAGEFGDTINSSEAYQVVLDEFKEMGVNPTGFLQQINGANNASAGQQNSKAFDNIKAILDSPEGQQLDLLTMVEYNVQDINAQISRLNVAEMRQLPPEMLSVVDNLVTKGTVASLKDVDPKVIAEARGLVNNDVVKSPVTENVMGGLNLSNIKIPGGLSIQDASTIEVQPVSLNFDAVKSEGRTV